MRVSKTETEALAGLRFELPFVYLLLSPPIFLQSLVLFILSALSLYIRRCLVQPHPRFRTALIISPDYGTVLYPWLYSLLIFLFSVPNQHLDAG
jgi:preprotein translocase subunit SecY